MRDRQPIGGVAQQEVTDATCSSAQVPTVVGISTNITPDPIGFINPTYNPGFSPVMTNPIPVQTPIIVQPSLPGTNDQKKNEKKKNAGPTLSLLHSCFVGSWLSTVRSFQ